MRSERPVNINLSPATFHWPVTAIASITHRLTGAVLFAAIAFLLYLLDMALESQSGFVEAAELLDQAPAKLILLATLAMLIYHLVAGVKHLLLDFHVGDSLEAASRASWLVFVVSAVLVVVAGVWLW
jgi:succinate dehydrogenase / fumarate reductase cytochrome b subunit